MTRTTRFAAAALLVCAATLSIPATLSAQTAQPVASPRANTEKLMLSFALSGASIDSDELESERESGGGFSLQLGWGFTRLFTLLVDASAGVLGSDDDEFVLVHFDLLGRFNFTSPQRALVPFVEAGISGRVAGQDDIVVLTDNGPVEVDLEISGGGLTFGGGLNYHVAPTVALGGSLRFTVGEFDTVKFNNISIEGFELDATSTRLNLGVTWYPMRGAKGR